MPVWCLPGSGETSGGARAGLPTGAWVDDDRSLAALRLDGDPISNPLTYPGAVPDKSGLLAQDRYLRLQPLKGRRLGQWRVAEPGGGLPGEPRTDGSRVPLNYALLRCNQAGVGDRYPVLAVGSNASPAQMSRKFAQRGVPAVLPMTTATAHGLASGVSAHISRPGYVAATPIVTDGARSQMLICWLSESQLAALDATEPNYTRLFLPGDRFPVALPSEEHLGGCYAYVSRWGCLLSEDGSPLRLSGQGELLAGLLARSAELRGLFGASPQTMVTRAARDSGLRERAQRVFEDEGWVGPQAELEALGPAQLRYDDLPPAYLADQDTSGHAWILASTTDGRAGRGEANVWLSPSAAARLGAPALVVVRSGNVAAESKIATIARLCVAHDAADDRAHIDQVARNAVGLEVGEHVLLAPARLRRHRRLDRAIGAPHYVTCRVQSADLAHIGADVCLIDSLTLDLLGILSGDEVVVEGLPGADGQVPQARIKAFRTSEPVQQLRESLHGGDETGRFPSARDALGVFPDLPWMFLDRATRAELGLADHKLGTVRVRVSRTHQFVKELREMLLLVSVAFIGLVSAFEGTALRLTLLGVLVAGVVTVRMRARLTRSAKVTLTSRSQ